MLTKDVLKAKFSADDNACGELMKVLDLFSSKTRFRILCILREQDFCVSDIAEIVEEGKISNISQQLKILSMSKIISRYRVEKRVFYKLEDERIRRIVDFLHGQYIDSDN
ncbi:MAG: metalloregulator ArsR/SmtB family transcription factor [Spirochaetia bacterium]|jgi:DNA-binding transcriptional ArsR family regulator|nr:metalloregulator ArsR/SmtB family transcription factor [Spirochaetia bacterium]